LNSRQLIRSHIEQGFRFENLGQPSRGVQTYSMDGTVLAPLGVLMMVSREMT